MSKKNRALAKAAILSGLLIATSQASAITIQPNDTSLTEYIPGITTFQTHGDDMVGLAVTATFFGGFSETEYWGAYGAGAGGVTGTTGTNGWSLSETSDTFTSPWTFLNNTGLALTSLVLDASHATGGGYIVFDRETSGTQGTLNSAQGTDITADEDVTVDDGDDGEADNNIVGSATYSVQVGVGAAAPVGDLWHILSMDFGDNGLDLRSWTFMQDTDNDIRHDIPEPASIAMMLLGFVGLGFMRRRSRC